MNAFTKTAGGGRIARPIAESDISKTMFSSFLENFLPAAFDSLSGGGATVRRRHRGTIADATKVQDAGECAATSALEETLAQ